MRKYRVKVYEGKTQKKNINKMPSAAMQIVDPSIDLPLALFLPSIPPSTLSSSDVITFHHALISLFLPTFPSIFSPSHHSFSHVHLSEKYECARVCMCQREKASEGQKKKKNVDNINYSSQTTTGHCQ